MTDSSDKIRAFAMSLAKEGTTELTAVEINAAVRESLLTAYFDAVRAEWVGWCEADPVLKGQLAVATKLMADAGYNDDPVCGLPGVEPMVAIVDGLKAISFEHTMRAAVMPLSAIFLNKVREVMTAAEAVTAATQSAPAEEPPAPPQTQ